MQSRPTSAENRILGSNRAARNLLHLTAAAGFCAAACVVAQAYVLSDVVNRVFIQRQTLTGVLFLLVWLLVLALIRAALIWSSDILAQRSASRLKFDVREKLTRQLALLGPAYIQSERSGELVHTVVEGVEDLDEYITAYQPARLLAGIVPVFVLIVIFLLDPLTTPILLFTGPILVLLLALIGSRVKGITERRFAELSWMSGFFLDMLQGLATLKMFGRSREQIENIREISQKFGNTTMDVLHTAFQTNLVLEWGATIATAFVAVEVSLRLMGGTLPFNRALAVLVITPEFFLPLRQLALKYHAGTAGKAAAERIFAILDTTPKMPRSQARRWVVPDCLDICFDDVSYAYADGQRPALQGFSLSIPNGKTIALVGATGAGKTTAAHLLLRFMEPDRGSITIGGARLETIDPPVWRSQVAWVPQIPHLFYGTIADNIRLARPDASQAELIAAARAAHAHDFISQLPLGYDTPVGERGARLSGGQQQRLAIARAFLKDAPLLILDEPTSFLDSSSETAIQDALSRLIRNRTVFIITHRLNLVFAADQVAVLDRGRVIEMGAPHELRTQEGPYQQLVALSEGGML